MKYDFCANCSQCSPCLLRNTLDSHGQDKQTYAWLSCPYSEPLAFLAEGVLRQLQKTTAVYSVYDLLEADCLWTVHICSHIVRLGEYHSIFECITLRPDQACSDVRTQWLDSP